MRRVTSEHENYIGIKQQMAYLFKSGELTFKNQITGGEMFTMNFIRVEPMKITECYGK